MPAWALTEQKYSSIIGKVLLVRMKKSIGKNPAAQALNAIRNKKLTAAERKESARNAARARWKGNGKNA